MIILRHPGVSTQTTAKALRVRPTKSTQARAPAIDKVARLLIADATGTMVLLTEAIIRIEQELIREKLKESQRGHVDSRCRDDKGRG